MPRLEHLLQHQMAVHTLSLPLPTEPTPPAVSASAGDELAPDQRGAAAAPAGGQAQAPAEEEDSEDELMITLDENATSYDPAAHHPSVHKPREVRGLGAQVPTQGPAAVSAPRPALGLLPGLTPGFGGSGAPAPSGFGFGAGRPAIGGVPRSAIPGLGGMAQSMGRGPTEGAGLCAAPLLGFGAVFSLACSVY